MMSYQVKNLASFVRLCSRGAVQLSSAGLVRRPGARLLSSNTQCLQAEAPGVQSAVLGDELVLSPSCVERLRNLNAEANSTGSSAPPQFLRIMVEGGGCSGFQYKFELDDKLQPDDRCFGPADAQVVTDEISLSFIKGATVEYHKELIRAAFRIVDNPQSEAGCSCGASFTVKL
ncbi:FeS cluster insertion protein [Trinorchestia longiramus]|nr:FeS cluster insertion protein [Trinorchestia longiramus]